MERVDSKVKALEVSTAMRLDFLTLFMSRLPLPETTSVRPSDGASASEEELAQM